MTVLSFNNILIIGLIHFTFCVVSFLNGTAGTLCSPVPRDDITASTGVGFHSSHCIVLTSPYLLATPLHSFWLNGSTHLCSLIGEFFSTCNRQNVMRCVSHVSPEPLTENLCAATSASNQQLDVHQYKPCKHYFSHQIYSVHIGLLYLDWILWHKKAKWCINMTLLCYATKSKIDYLRLFKIVLKMLCIWKILEYLSTMNMYREICLNSVKWLKFLKKKKKNVCYDA